VPEKDAKALHIVGKHKYNATAADAQRHQRIANPQAQRLASDASRQKVGYVAVKIPRIVIAEF
jgi:hypothetical protein